MMQIHQLTKGNVSMDDWIKETDFGEAKTEDERLD